MKEFIKYVGLDIHKLTISVAVAESVALLELPNLLEHFSIDLSANVHYPFSITLFNMLPTLCSRHKEPGWPYCHRLS